MKGELVYIEPVPEGMRKCDDWTEDAIKLVNERFLRKSDEGKPIETIEDMCWRVAYHIASANKRFGKTNEEVIALAVDFYNLMAERRFFPNAPTMYNAGTGNGLQLSACFVLPIEDSMEGIYDAIKWQALIHKSGGGTGFSFSRLRQKNAIVDSTRGRASGPISFLEVFNASTDKVVQGGSRRGANMAVFSVHHPDILEVIKFKGTLNEENGAIFRFLKPYIYSRTAREILKTKLIEEQISHFNISIAATDVFMKAVKEDTEYDLIDPRYREVIGRLKAKEVFGQIVKMAWDKGCPGLWFIDKTNRWRANPIEGMQIESTNPCGEQPLYPFDSCNLGSIALAYYLLKENGGYVIDWSSLEQTVRLAVRFLDNVIELNPYPLQQITDFANKIRRIGLGVMGWADMLAYLGIPYASEEACKLAEKVMEFINKIGHDESEKLAEERGAFPFWERSIYKDGKPIRNATITTVAPTGELSILSGCSGGIEPHYGLTKVHHYENRILKISSPAFRRFIEIAKERGFYSTLLEEEVKKRGQIGNLESIPDDIKKVFATAHEISPEWHILMQAAFQKNVDNGVSKTINMASSVTPADVEKAYWLAYETECLGVTVFRDGCKGQVLSVGIKEDVSDFSPPSITQGYIRPRPKVLGATECIKTPDGAAFITINFDREKGPRELFEVFVNVAHAGTDVLADAEAIGRGMSFALRLNSPMPLVDRLKEYLEQYRGIGGSRSSGFGKDQVNSLADGIGKAIEIYLSDFGLEQENGGELEIQGNYCPQCHKGTLLHQEGCTRCTNCSYTTC